MASGVGYPWTFAVKASAIPRPLGNASLMADYAERERARPKDGGGPSGSSSASLSRSHSPAEPLFRLTQSRPTGFTMPVSGARPPYLSRPPQVRHLAWLIGALNHKK